MKIPLAIRREAGMVATSKRRRGASHQEATMTDSTHKEYTLQVTGTISAPTGLHSKVFRMTDEAALADAQQMAKAFANVRWFMSITVWCGDDRVVGHVTLDEVEPKTSIRLGGKR